MSQKVTETLYIGDIQDSKVCGLEFEAVISLGVETEHTTKFFDIPDTDAHSYERFESAVDSIRSVAFDDGSVTLVHCNAGISRSVSACTAALVVEEDVRFYDALDRCKRTHFSPNTSLLNSAREYVREHTNRRPR